MLLTVVLLLTMVPANLTLAQDQGGVLPTGDNPVAVVDGAEVAPEQVWVDPQAAPIEQASAEAQAAPIEQAVVSQDPVAPVTDAVAYTMNPSPAPPPSSAAPVIPTWSPPSTVYIPETGQSVDGVFLDVWRAWGGALSWGNPITQEFWDDNGHIVQYYSFGRFEYWPEDPNGEVVKFGAIGEESRPYMIRRALPGKSAQMSHISILVEAWMPLNPNEVPPDSGDWRYIPETMHGVAGDFKTFWEATGEAAYLGNPVSEQYEIDGVRYQVFERGAVAQEPGGYPYVLPTGEYAVERQQLDRTPIDQGALPTYDEELFSPPPVVQQPGPGGVEVDPNAERWLQVSISQQYMWARQGDVVLWEGYVSTGKPGFDTPTGTFYINRKLPVEDMAGVIGGESYNVPEVPDVMYFTDYGHAIHGTYWHNNFGVPMSHGCINLPLDVSAWMYQWLNVGARVEIMP